MKNIIVFCRLEMAALRYILGFLHLRNSDTPWGVNLPPKPPYHQSSRAASFPRPAESKATIELSTSTTVRTITNW